MFSPEVGGWEEGREGVGTPVLRSVSVSLSDGIIEGSLFAFGIFLSGMSPARIFSHGYLG